MARLVLMRGLPGSGKSTKSKELLAEYGNAVRVNRDLLRSMLHCDVWSGKKERITKDVAKAIVGSLLLHSALGAPEKGSGVGVIIIDDCNLGQGTVESWRAVAKGLQAQFEIIRMDTPLEECLRRDALREKPVGRHVILGMAMQYGLMPPPVKGYVLCDIDGTIAEITHRLSYVKQQPRDWDGFFGAMGDDGPRRNIIEMVLGLARGGHEIVFVSGRPDTYRTVTEQWLWNHLSFGYTTLFMRRAGDHRPDTVVKEEILRTYFSDLSRIYTVFDDRPSVIQMWREHGLNVVDVGIGEEF